ncbi:MAG: PilZ domain-containing protein [Acidisphaera sp.]|nr:PilZ domain-containing protein [Acidisphaera sp.]
MRVPLIASSASRPGAERRREKRYQVDLPGTVRVGEMSSPVTVSDLSASGALVAFDTEHKPFRAGTQLILLLDEFGAIEARIVHVGNGFYGLSFVNPHLHRDRLTQWLRQEVGAA